MSIVEIYKSLLIIFSLIEIYPLVLFEIIVRISGVKFTLSVDFMLKTGHSYKNENIAV